ncbi:MAG: hypothetical protein EP330_19535 [Deltaproteobacteria bacterium]|nr:MAG: hypothetical protein EP330_19535 [Deltaproteobacteria bacterium]
MLLRVAEGREDPPRELAEEPCAADGRELDADEALDRLELLGEVRAAGAAPRSGADALGEGLPPLPPGPARAAVDSRSASEAR